MSKLAKTFLNIFFFISAQQRRMLKLPGHILVIKCKFRSHDDNIGPKYKKQALKFWACLKRRHVYVALWPSGRWAEIM